MITKDIARETGSSGPSNPNALLFLAQSEHPDPSRVAVGEGSASMSHRKQTSRGIHVRGLSPVITAASGTEPGRILGRQTKTLATLLAGKPPVNEPVSTNAESAGIHGAATTHEMTQREDKRDIVPDASQDTIVKGSASDLFRRVQQQYGRLGARLRERGRETQTGGRGGSDVPPGIGRLRTPDGPEMPKRIGRREIRNFISETGRLLRNPQQQHPYGDKTDISSTYQRGGIIGTVMMPDEAGMQDEFAEVVAIVSEPHRLTDRDEQVYLDRQLSIYPNRHDSKLYYREREVTIDADGNKHPVERPGGREAIHERGVRLHDQGAFTATPERYHTVMSILHSFSPIDGVRRPFDDHMTTVEAYAANLSVQSTASVLFRSRHEARVSINGDITVTDLHVDLDGELVGVLHQYEDAENNTSLLRIGIYRRGEGVNEMGDKVCDYFSGTFLPMTFRRDFDDESAANVRQMSEGEPLDPDFIENLILEFDAGLTIGAIGRDESAALRRFLFRAEGLPLNE
ncbi:MAG TPA: hypothetical protein VND99_01000 [Candidatus Acidoferrales bacterium]|nr:hypothetical protein [Candidatus Acidoferrales bacterium]